MATPLVGTATVHRTFLWVYRSGDGPQWGKIERGGLAETSLLLRFDLSPYVRPKRGGSWISDPWPSLPQCVFELSKSIALGVQVSQRLVASFCKCLNRTTDDRKSLFSYPRSHFQGHTSPRPRSDP